MPTKSGKLTREEKRELNQKLHKEANQKIWEAKAQAKKELLANVESNKIEDLIAAGMPIEQACNKVGVSTRDFYNQIRSDDNFREKITRAKEVALDAIEDKIRTTAKEAPKQIYDAQGNAIYDKTELQWRALVIDTEKWYLGIKNPRKYGGKSQEVEVTNNINITSSQIDDKLKAIIDVTPKKKGIEELI